MTLKARLESNKQFITFSAKKLRLALKHNVAPNARNIECIIKIGDEEYTIKNVTSEYDDFTGFNYPIIYAEKN